MNGFSNSSSSRHATASAYLMLGSGVALSAMGFYVEPVGEISDSVLWLLGQTLLYAGSIFGVTVYVRQQLERTGGTTRSANPPKTSKP